MSAHTPEHSNQFYLGKPGSGLTFPDLPMHHVETGSWLVTGGFVAGVTVQTYGEISLPVNDAWSMLGRAMLGNSTFSDMDQTAINAIAQGALPGTYKGIVGLTPQDFTAQQIVYAQNRRKTNMVTINNGQIEENAAHPLAIMQLPLGTQVTMIVAHVNRKDVRTIECLGKQPLAEIGHQVIRHYLRSEEANIRGVWRMVSMPKRG